FNGPQAAFADIGRQPRWLPPLVIVSIISFLCSLVSIPKLKEFTLYTLELQAQTMPELADAAAMDIAVSGLVIFALIGGLFSPAIMCLLYAGLLKLFNLFAGEPAPFRQFFAVTVYSYFPIIFAAVIATIMILMSPATHLEEVSTSLYLLFPPGSKGFAANIARQIDPFFLWSLVLMALGSSVISRARFKSYAIFLGVLWLLFAVGSAMLGQGVSY
ncbi:MAG TPA: YIP1 family protein, partial [Syntrophomonadaceae bacterium]|nr:YIP1 family protein [Syntrophomonadaceae bacterium]